MSPAKKGAPAANDLRRLEDAATGTNLLTDGILDLSTNRWTTEFLPLFTNRSSPTRTLDLIIDRPSSTTRRLSRSF